MTIPAIIKNNPLLIGGVIVAVIAVLWISTRGAKQTGRDIGGGAVDLVFGTVGGAGGAVVDNMNDPHINPLYGFGSSVGETLFNWTH